MITAYVLDGTTPVPEPDLDKWMKIFGSESAPHVAFHEPPSGYVSTIFTGIATSHGRDAAPRLFETMVSGGVFDNARQRYGTWEEAELGHAYWLMKVLAMERSPDTNSA